MPTDTQEHLLSASTTLAATDLVRVVTDPSGSPSSKVMTANLFWRALQLLGSNIQVAETVQVTDLSTPVTITDKYYFLIPQAWNGMNLIRANARVLVAGTTGATTVQVTNILLGHAMLSTTISIASGATLGTPGTVDASYDNVLTDGVLRISVTAVSTTPPMGLIVTLEFQLP